MDNINKFMRGNPKYLGLKKPLQAAKVCDIARAQAHGHYDIISYRDGLLTVGVTSSSHAADIQMRSNSIIAAINEKLCEKLVEKIKYKVV